MRPDARETRRRAAQAVLDEESGRARNRLGQFATPPALAEAIVEATLPLVDRRGGLRFLEPALGTGSFFSALRRRLPDLAATGFEADPEVGRVAAGLWQGTGLDLRVEDFTRAAPADGERYDLLVTNPPYVRHHHLASDEKRRLQRAALSATGIALSGLAGLHAHFLLLADPWLADGAVGCWLIPGEFMDVAYGEALRRYLVERVTLLRIHRFAAEDVQFADALVSSAIVWYRRTPPVAGHRVELTLGGALSRPAEVRLVDLSDLRAAAKWPPPSTGTPAEEGPRIGDLFVVRRGLATGGNGFFIVSDEQARRLRLPRRFLRPILPGPRDIDGDEIDADAEGLPLLAARRFLLDCRLPEEEARRSHPSLWRYLESGRAEVAGRYLCRHRHPWYAQERREPAPFLCTYMGRAEGGRPLRFLLNRSLATAPNVYLMLHPRPEAEAALRREPGLARRVLDELNRPDAGRLARAGRTYGGGLQKLEPRELAAVPAGEIAKLLGIEGGRV